MDKKIITISIKPYYWQLFKYYAKEEGRSLSNWLEMAGKDRIKANKEENNLRKDLANR